MNIHISSEDDMLNLGKKIGSACSGGEFIELIGDVGAGKTTFTKGLALGMGIKEEIQSPTFTISRIYDSDDNDLTLMHYDFYRLSDAGIMYSELNESASKKSAVVVVEWSDIVSDVLPKDRLIININYRADDGRDVIITSNGNKSQKVMEAVKI